MKNSISIFLILIAIACDQQPTQSQDPIPTRTVSMYDSPLIDRELAVSDPYDLNYELQQISDRKYKLITYVTLRGGSFFVSPFSTTEFKGRFRLETAITDKLKLEKEHTESPRSIEEIDPHRFVNGPVNWVSSDTRYEHLISITAEDDFCIGGKYQFVIEPRCTLEEIPFILEYKNGKLSIGDWKC